MSIRGHYIESIFIPQIEFAQAWVKNRFLPTFGNLKEEADQITKEHNQNASVGEWDDPGEAAEGAFEKGLDFLRSGEGFQQGFVSLLFVHLYHLVEQQLAMIVRDENGFQPDFKFRTSGQLLDAFFKEFKVDITYLETWTAVDELRLIANTVKHSDAGDSEKLRRRRPDLFVPKWALGKEEAWIYENQKVEQALSGEDFYPTVEEYDAKVNSVVTFWREVASVLDGKRKVKTLAEWVHENRGGILELASKHGASKVRVFGSVARGEAGPTSDVDLLVDLAPETSFGEELELVDELEGLLGRKVDLCTEGVLKRGRRDRILKEARPL